MNMANQKHAQLTRRMARQGGMTLIEIILVVVILMMIMGAVVAFVLPRQGEAQINTTRMKLNQIDQQIQLFTLHIGRAPSEEEGLRALVRRPQFENETLTARWQGPYLDPDFDFNDPWGNPIRYEPIEAGGMDEENLTGRPYRLYSMGPDGQPDTEQDIYARVRQDDADDI